MERDNQKPIRTVVIPPSPIVLSRARQPPVQGTQPVPVGLQGTAATRPQQTPLQPVATTRTQQTPLQPLQSTAGQFTQPSQSQFNPSSQRQFDQSQYTQQFNQSSFVDDDDEELSRAIEASLGRRDLTPPTFPEDDIYDEDFAAAIELSLAAARQATTAAQRVNELEILRKEQDEAYETSLRQDMARREAEEAAQAALELAKQAELQAEEALRIEKARQEALRIPDLQYPIEKYNKSDLLTLRFRLLDGSIINHTFHKNEPMRSLIQQIRFDMKYLGGFEMIMQPNKPIICNEDYGLADCGVADRILITVRRTD